MKWQSKIRSRGENHLLDLLNFAPVFHFRYNNTGTIEHAYKRTFTNISDIPFVYVRLSINFGSSTFDVEQCIWLINYKMGL